jgi:phosphate uptake regulator
MQHARDEYGPLEDDYSRLEDILDQMEFEMAKIEARLYGPESPQEFENANIISPFQEPSDSLLLGSNPLLGLSTDVHEQYQPIHRELLSRLGDLDLARERYENMRQERESLSTEQESRARFGLELHENLKMLLADLPTQEAAVKEEIAEIEVDVERLRAECLDAGIDIDLSDAGSGITADIELDANDAPTTEN